MADGLHQAVFTGAWGCLVSHGGKQEGLLPRYHDADSESPHKAVS